MGGEKNLSQGNGKTFSMVLPPPNVTGSLHLGHALTATVQDVLVRWHRMKGYNCLWIPGTDHAGIATQTVVEKQLIATQSKTRHELGRDEFINLVWEWKEKYGDRIVHQLKRTGASLNWDLNAFTMDQQRELAVRVAFNSLYDSGLIYRAKRLVNWCPYLRSVISDIEVDHLDLEGRTYLPLPNNQRVESGVIYRIRYPVKTIQGKTNEIDFSSEFLEVETTRPETILGDTALAIHPDDVRYKDYHNRQAVNPLTATVIPIVTDSILVNMEMGTGVVKVTPAHDPNDYACGSRHSLHMVVMLNIDGSISDNCPERFRGLDRFVSRRKVVEELKDRGLLVEKKSHTMSVAVCSRSHDIIEPMLLPQWFLMTKELSQKAVDSVRSGRIEFHPEAAVQDWYNWLERDQRYQTGR
eukprot:TRINITY_DN9079_c0_g1_i18.p1 TRINITY_DN9079_c0_g1~~TRINITY_DN9079_c0_g1_i18.p1  ORF type:complete len:428 (-),score=89.51 TRINITY_DN9079_c0_g1_i18:71-1303(-)